jgi:hypothetical protein
MKTYYLILHGCKYDVDSTPLISILGFPTDDIEALKYVDDVIDPSTFNRQFFCALIQVEKILALSSIQIEESLAKLSQTLLFPVVVEAAPYLTLHILTILICYFPSFKFKLRIKRLLKKDSIGLRDVANF